MCRNLSADYGVSLGQMSKSCMSSSYSYLLHYTMQTNKNKVFRTLMYIMLRIESIEYKYKVSEIREEDG